MLLAVALGGRSLLKRVEIEALLKGVLTILTASCFIILASPALRDLSVFPVLRLQYGLTGSFTQPHDAGFIGCMTTALTLARFCNDRRRKLSTCCCLTVSVATALGSLSWTACIALTVLWFLYLLWSGVCVRLFIFRWGIVAGGIGTFVYLTTEMKGIEFGRESDSNRDLSLLCSTVPPSNSGLIRDCTILLTIRDTLAGGARLNWNDSTSIVSWDGVKLSDSPRVLSLDLRRTGLRGRIPTELSRLDRLTGLWLDHNQLTGSIPPELGRLANLRVLGLSFNVLTGPIPPELGNLSNLEELLLRGNDLTGGIPAELEKLDNLWRLHYRSDDPFGPLNALVKTDNRDIEKRVLLWRTGTEKFLESPLIGAGIGRLRYDVMKGPFISNEERSPGVHNMYLMLAGEAGIVPLSFYIFFLFSLLRLRWTVSKSLGRDVAVYWALIMGLYGMAFHHLLTLGVFVWFAGLCCAIAATLGRGLAGDPPPVPKRRWETARGIRIFPKTRATPRARTCRRVVGNAAARTGGDAPHGT